MERVVKNDQTRSIERMAERMEREYHLKNNETPFEKPLNNKASVQEETSSVSEFTGDADRVNAVSEDKEKRLVAQLACEQEEASIQPRKIFYMLLRSEWLKASSGLWRQCSSTKRYRPTSSSSAAGRGGGTSVW